LTFPAINVDASFQSCTSRSRLGSSHLASKMDMSSADVEANVSDFNDERQPLLDEHNNAAQHHSGEIPVPNLRHSLIEENTSGDEPHAKKRHIHMELDPTIYSTVLYCPAIMRIKNGSELSGPTWRLAALVALNMILQLGLLRVLDVYGHRDSQKLVGGLINQGQVHQASKKTYEAFLLPKEREVVAEGMMSPLCRYSDNGTYSCAPPSTRFVSTWHALDLDGDGMWTMAEAKATAENYAKNVTITGDWILKKPGVVFNSIVNGLKLRAVFAQNNLNQTLYISPDLKTKLGIPKAYFDFWVGDAMMCTHFDRYSCNNLVASGLFDVALTDGRMAAAHKGIFDLDSATKYCQMMLEEGGGCEQTLPASFLQNTLQRRNQCGSSSLGSASAFITNPVDDSDVVPLMKVSFSKVVEFSQSTDAMFLFFKILIMFLFYSSLVDELRDLIQTGEFLLRFDGIKNVGDRGGGIEDDPQSTRGKHYTITGISRKHRAAMIVILFLRMIILCTLTSYGTWFLLNEGRYIELVLNALALSFITGIDEVLYNFVDEQELSLNDVEPVKSMSHIPGPETWIGMMYSKEFWGLVILPVISIFVVMWNCHYVRVPLLEALTCTCTQTGPNCAESIQNQLPWWKNYWSQVLPSAVHQIEGLRLQGM